MDIWEANSMANAYTPHPCDFTGQLRCEGTDCGDNDSGERYDGVCDKDGCDINPYRMGNRMFYGRGSEYEVNTLKPVTVVTQFLTTDGTDDGELSEMVRFYVQDGNVIESPSSTILGPDDTDSITDGFCQAQKRLFGDVNDYANKGGSAAMGESLDRGHVMAMSIWDDVEVNMLWLDSAWPLNKPATDPGVQRGDCPGGVGSTPTYLRQNYPDGWVSFQNAFVGPIGSFMSPPPPSPSPPPPTPAPTPRPKPTAAPSPVPTQSPTPRPQPTAAPSPVPTQCIMEKATVPEGCKEGPVDGWAGLGLGLTEEECQLACIEEDACVLAVYKSQEKSCAYFRECSKFKNQAGFVMWQKKCEDGDAKFFPGEGRGYAQSKAFCAAKNKRICNKDDICPGGHNTQPVGGMMGGDVWVPIGDTTNDWVSIGMGSGHVGCASHNERGFGLPPWGHNHNSYNQRIYCCPLGSA